MSEAKNAEAELAKVIRDATEQYIIDALPIARAILAAGYAKREGVLEECEATIKALKPGPGEATYKELALSRIRSLKGQP